MVDLTNEELMEIIRERGLFPIAEPERVAELSLRQKLQTISEEHHNQITEAKSVNFIPSNAKTALLDIAMDTLLRIDK